MKKQILLSIGLATLLTSTTQAQQQLARSMQQARTETARTSVQLKETLAVTIH